MGHDRQHQPRQPVVRLNDELNLIVYDREIARRLEAIFAADLAYSERLEYRKWRARGLFDRILELMALPINDTL